MTVVPNPAPEVPEHPSREEARATLGIARHALGTAGRLTAQKALGDAIEALGRVPGVELLVLGDGPERAALERYALRQAPTIAPALALAGLTAALFVRLLPDVSGKPLHEDEAVAGLVSARPLGEVLHTVVLDRGGAPLHFVLAHVALAFDSSPDALRWLSVVFALATVPLCYDLGRRLAGQA